MTAGNKLWRNRKERKDWARRLRSENPGLEVVHPHAAGIDVGNSAHYVAVRPDRDPESVRRFECFTADLYRLAEWLASCGVKTVALQSTGVYLIQGLCPHNRISGDKLLGKGTRHVVNRAATALRLAARNLIRSRSYLGAQYRRLRTKLGAPKAITAMAHRLARLVYRMLKYGQRYVDKGTEYYENRYRQQQIHLL